MAIALRNNRQLAVSQYDLEVANKQVAEAYGGLFPEIDGFASLQRNLELPSAFLPKIFIVSGVKLLRATGMRRNDCSAVRAIWGSTGSDRVRT